MTQRAKQPRHLTLEQHRRLGIWLKTTRDGLIHTRLPYAATSPIQRALTKTITAIDTLRCRLDSQLAKEAGSQFETRVYYPGHTAPDTPSVLAEVEAEHEA